jgi:hypothetical protein
LPKAFIEGGLVGVVRLLSVGLFGGLVTVF